MILMAYTIVLHIIGRKVCFRNEQDTVVLNSDVRQNEGTCQIMKCW